VSGGVPARVDESGWQARLRLGFRRGPGRTVLADRMREGPLAVQRPFYPEGEVCHVYLLHPPGGVAGGDTLDIETTVGEGASALVTTPGATKFYRSVGAEAGQHQRLRVESGSLEWLPRENIFFPGANAELTTRVDLIGGARFIGWEIHCLGRPVIGERFEDGRMVARFSIWRDGLPLLHERLAVDGEESLNRPAGLRGRAVVASLYATVDETLDLEPLREAMSGEVGITVVDGLLVARYLGESTEQAGNHFIHLWKQIRIAALGREPCSPRIWNT